jgi:hypothetical protein
MIALRASEVAKKPAAHRQVLQRPPRPTRRQPTAPIAPLGGLETGESFRLSEPPEAGEPHGPFPFSSNWLALAAAIGTAAYYLVR